MTTSSTTVPIDHAAEARTILHDERHASTYAPWSQTNENAHLFHIAEAIGAHLAANAHATLAIAHEQRTANLIAYLAIAPGRPTAERLRDDIEARLGLGEPA